MKPEELSQEDQAAWVAFIKKAVESEPAKIVEIVSKAIAAGIYR